MSHSSLERIIGLAAKDSKKGARVAAKVFYRILRKNGFMDNQIINIATNILSCLTESLKKIFTSADRVRVGPSQPVRAL